MKRLLLPRNREERKTIDELLVKIYKEAAEKTKELNRWRVIRLHPAQERMQRARAARRAKLVDTYLRWERKNRP